MLGMFTGAFVRDTRDRLSGDRQTLLLVLASIALAALGLLVAFGCGSWSFPISKPLWSPSFTLLVGSYSVLMFAIFYWLIDVRCVWRHTLFFRVIGLNAIAIYLAQQVLGLSNVNRLLFGRFAGWFPAPWADVVSATTYVLVCWALLFWLHRKKLYFKV